MNISLPFDLYIQKRGMWHYITRGIFHENGIASCVELKGYYDKDLKIKIENDIESKSNLNHNTFKYKCEKYKWKIRK